MQKKGLSSIKDAFSEEGLGEESVLSIENSILCREDSISNEDVIPKFSLSGKKLLMKNKGISQRSLVKT